MRDANLRAAPALAPRFVAVPLWQLVRAVQSLSRQHWQWAIGLALFFSVTGTVLIQFGVQQSTVGWQTLLFENALCELPVAVIALLGVALVEQGDRGTRPPLLRYLLVVVVAAGCGGMIFFGASTAANQLAALTGLARTSNFDFTPATLVPHWIAHSLGWTFSLGAVVFTYVYLRNAARLARTLASAEARSAETRRALLANDLAATQALVDPGFLFATLKLVEQRHEVDAAAGDRVLEALIAYLRAALPLLEAEPSTLGRQGELVHAYLQIEQARIGAVLAFAIDVPADLADVPFPPLLLLPLVDDAVHHGIESSDRGGHVAITAGVVAGRIWIEVSDTGAARSAAPGSSRNLDAVRERIAGLYGAHGRLEVSARPDGGITARIEVPHEANPRRHR